jgi:hypothetical protein
MITMTTRSRQKYHVIRGTEAVHTFSINPDQITDTACTENGIGFTMAMVCQQSHRSILRLV